MVFLFVIFIHYFALGLSAGNNAHQADEASPMAGPIEARFPYVGQTLRIFHVERYPIVPADAIDSFHFCYRST